MARRRGKSSGRKGNTKRSGQWYGFQAAGLIVDSSAVDALIVVPPNTNLNVQSDATYMGMRVNSITNALPIRSPAQQVVWNVQKSEFTSPTVGVNTIDPATFDKFDLANADVLWHDYMNLAQSMGGLIADDEPMFGNVDRFILRSKRKLDMRRHGIILALSGFSAIDTTVNLIAKAYVKY